MTRKIPAIGPIRPLGRNAPKDRLMIVPSAVRLFMGAGPFAAAVATFASAGCSEELGPEPMPSASVAGRVVRGGDPIGRGWVEFLPVDGTVGRLRSARIGPDGRFRADGVAVGRVGLRIVGGPLEPIESTMLGQMYLMRRDVPPEGVVDVLIDLEVERRAIADGGSG